MRKEKCIMPKSIYWGIKRDRINNTRHEIYNAHNRQNSIKEGLVIFIPIELHEILKRCFQYDPNIRAYMKWLAMMTWCKTNKKTKKDFYMVFHEYGVKPKMREKDIFEPIYKNYQWVIQHNEKENRMGIEK